MNERDAAFAAYYAARGATLRGTAYLLCGSWHLAEDLTQAAFIKLYRVWGRVSKSDTMDAYVRQVLIRTFLDERRRPWRREYSVEPNDDRLSVAQSPADVVVAVDLRRALDAVPPRQRAVLILRFWLDLPVEQVAEELGCTAGTVTMQLSLRALACRNQPAYLPLPVAGNSSQPTPSSRK